MSGYFPPIVINSTGGGTSTSASADVDMHFVFYEVITAGADRAAGDVLQKISYIKTSDQTTAAGDKWINLNSQVVLSTPPAVADIKPLKGGGLTAGELGTIILKTQEQVTSPVFTHLGKTDDAPAAEDGTGSYSLIAGLKRLVLVAIGIANKIPVLVSGKIPVQGEDWNCVEYKLDTNGQLVFEKEKFGTVVRSRAWAAVTDAQGNVTYTAGEWA